MYIEYVQLGSINCDNFRVIANNSLYPENFFGDFFEMQFQGGGISGHFFPEDPSAEVFGPVGGRAKCREYAPHSMLTCKGRWWPEQNYKQWM